MVCRHCHHPTTDLSHDFCRTHAYCNRDGQYHGALCTTCDELWERAQDIENPSDAVPAFQMLKSWIEGYRRNSKARPPGCDFFFDPQERSSYEDLFAVHANLRIIARMDSQQQQQRQRVRFLRIFVLELFFDGNLFMYCYIIKTCILN